MGGISINIQDIKHYLKGYECERLTSDITNKTAINNFSAPTIGKRLEEYLKNKAWEADSDGETCVYLVKDSDGNIALFFSIKCGLLYEKTNYERLEEDELEFVNMVIQAKLSKDEESVQNVYDIGESLYGEDVERLFRIADERIDTKDERKRFDESDSTLRASKCFSAIELQHFCRNDSYESKIDVDFPLGFGIFWEVVVPKILEVVKMVGCKYIYLFAADNSEEAENVETGTDEIRKLVRYYKNDLMFKEVSGITIIKPDYDENCRGLIQDINSLESNAQTAWIRYSDFI